MAHSSFVIVGAGLAGAKAVEALRELGFDGRLTLIGDEEHLPYERPPLSKGYLAGNDSRESFIVHDAGWYDDHDVTLVLGRTTTAVDPDAHEVTLVDGNTHRYDKLLLATGSRARQLPLPGAGSLGVQTLRNVEDSDRISQALDRGGRLAVVGGGWIGMEVAANARDRGAEVTVIEAADVPLGLVLGPELAQVFLDLHREHGVTFHLGAQVSELTSLESKVTGVRLGDGTLVEADAVLVGIGAQPNIELAEAAGLDVDNGVLVDAALQSSNPDILAAGDIANHEHPVLGRRVRVEHWANALNQPAAAAATMLGTPTAYTELPYFFTDQYDLGMEYVGHAPPGSYARVVTRGNLRGREFIAFWLDGSDHVLAGMNVNVWDVVDDVKTLILSGRPVDTQRLADPDLPLAASLRA
ncbi:MAG: 3-phenylpropionate/trans-cinnamate dioxygenase ferredoxin reductase component [Nocardioidaceae bacterium]|nr:3-phenylpropionate/trans-cinnamate dioxygenase ferredoxin reductase component [Nocardioidaceae bacterium]